MATLPKKKIAFLIEAHSDPKHLARLVRRLSPHDVFVHWDAKSGRPPDIPGAQMITERVAVFWAGFTQVSATIFLIRAALASGQVYSKLVLISGACYPIRPVSELQALFADDGDRNYIGAIRVNEVPFLAEQTGRRYWRDAVLPTSIPRNRKVFQVERYLRAGLNLAMRLLPRRRPPLELFHGSSWWALTPEAAGHTLKIYETRPDLRRFFSLTFASDEKFFHSLLRNSPFAESCDPPLPFNEQGILHKGVLLMVNLHVIDDSLVKWFDERDIPLIAQSEKFFVRKVRSGTSDALLDWVDAHRLMPGGDND